MCDSVTVNGFRICVSRRVSLGSSSKEGIPTQMRLAPSHCLDSRTECKGEHEPSSSILFPLLPDCGCS